MNSAPKGVRRLALGIGAMSHVVQDGMTATVYVLLPTLAQTFGFSYAEVGMFKALKAVAQGTLEMISGVLAERIGEARTLILGFLLSGLGYALISFAPTAPVVLICLIIIGAGTAFHHAPSSSLIVIAYAGSGRSGALGLYNSSGDVGKLVFTGLFSLGLGAGMAWQHISFLIGMTAVLAAAATGFAALRLVRGGKSKTAVRTGVGEEDKKLGWGILDKRSYITLLGVIYLDTMVQAGVLVFVAFLMIERGIPLSLATLATVTLLVGGVFGKASCGFLAQRMGIRPAFALIQILTAVGMVSIAFAPIWLAFPLLLPLGAVAQGTTSITYGYIPELVHPKRMARGYALMYASSSFSSAAGPLTVGVIADHLGLPLAMVAMAVIALVAVPGVYMMPSKSALAKVVRTG